MKPQIDAPIRDLSMSKASSLNVKILQIGILVLFLIAGAVFFLVSLNIKDKKNEMEQTLEKRSELLSGSRVEIISTWLAGLTAQGNRVIQSDVFRLYATDIDQIEGDVSMLISGPLEDEPAEEGTLSGLSEQLPMMVSLLKEFTDYSGFLAGRIINRNGQAYIATNAATTPLTEKQKALIKSTFSTNGPNFSPLRSGPHGLILDIFLPILPPEGAMDGPPKPVAVLMLSKIVTEKITDLLSRSPLAREGERIRLVQFDEGNYQEIIPWMMENLRKLETMEIDDSGKMPFAVRSPLDGKERVYSMGDKVPELDWWVIQESDYMKANESLRGYKRSLITIVSLVLLALILFLGGAWWRIIGVENRKIADQFKRLAEQIERQHQFLDSINATITDYIAYKDKSGKYRYVNPAFAGSIGREVEEIIGSDDRAVFGFDTAKRLQTSDDHVYEKKEALSFNEKIYLQSKLHFLLITKIPFKDSKDNIVGIVSVFRDITELVETQEKNERTIRQTIEAFVKTIEMRDPYLAGHSRLMSVLAKSVATELKADEEVRGTVELSAFLSQIGKVFVDQSILSKPGKLTEEEMREVEKHVEHTAAILKGIDFELPISETIYQMNENIDGSGYPKGLKGDEIMLSAKILAVVNSFCAMIKPRSYRSALAPEQALSILEKDGMKYSERVVKALKEIIQTPEGEKMIRQ